MPKERAGSVKYSERRKCYIARVTYYDLQGKKHDIRRQSKDLTNAKRELKRILRSLEEHGPRVIDAERMTFSTLAEVYSDRKLIEPVYKGETRIAGLRSWRNQKGFLKPLQAYFGKQRLQSITHSDLEDYRAKRIQLKTRRGEERTITGINRELSLMRTMFNFALKQGWVVQSPFDMGESLISHADENQRDRILTPEEEIRLLAACEDRNREHLRPLIIAALDTALRFGELIQLIWTDVNLEDGMVVVRKTTTKTWESRVIGMTSRLRAELQKLWDNSTGNKDELIFGIEDNITKAFTTARELAQIEDLKFHDFRHTATTRMIQAGMAPGEVMNITGHKEISTFLRYLNSDRSTAKRAAEALDKLYSSAEKKTDEIS